MLKKNLKQIKPKQGHDTPGGIFALVSILLLPIKLYALYQSSNLSLFIRYMKTQLENSNNYSIDRTNVDSLSNLSHSTSSLFLPKVCIYI